VSERQLYLRSTVAANAKLDNKIFMRIGSTNAVYEKLSTGLWTNRHVSIKAKCQVYCATLLAALLHAASNIFSVQLDRLQAYVMQNLCSIMVIY